MQDTDPAASHWLRLAHTPGVGPVTVQRLLQHFDHPQDIFSAGHAALAALVSDASARALCTPPDDGGRDAIARALAWQQLPAHQLLTLADPRYPALLRQIPDPPVVLYAVGRIALLDAPAVAIVGSRNATAQGVANAGAFAQALSGAGLTIVSGMALGIDAAAHEGGLLGAGSTVAVVGTGIDRIYPRSNQQLAYRIAEHGCIVSEYPLGMRPLAANFPRRNRLISGLACAVLVVEAAAGSGSLITAHVANEQGRDVFAIPGSIHAPLAKGCHKLIKQGAKLVESAADLLDELRMAPLARMAELQEPACGGEFMALLDALGHGPVGTDRLAALTRTPPGLLAGQLLALELAGHIERLPGGLFQRVHT